MLTAKIDTYFRELTGYPAPREFQRQAIARLWERKNVLLRAPTGSGKTETAIAPFLFSKLETPTDAGFPNKLIYVVPLRTLANSLRDRVRDELVELWLQAHPLKRSLAVTLQTGENPEDPRFEGDIVFCTIDQLASSFLNIPYSVGRGSANVNAGSVFSSYLVFDELHLLDPDRSFATVLKLLSQVQGVVPYLLMTATLTEKLAASIREEIGDYSGKHSLELVDVLEGDLQAIEAGRKRTFTAIPEPLSARVILDDIQKRDRKRAIVICNQVGLAQDLYRDLQALASNANLSITLLHSRFLPEDRAEKEAKLLDVFGKDWRDRDDGTCHVLIATQVIEVGLNITCEVMHVQLCPANALLQRAGRCARFRNESGEVHVYRKIQTEKSEFARTDEADEEASPEETECSFLPYQKETCEETWRVLQEDANLDSVGFATEQGWIDRVHKRESDREVQRRQENRLEFEQRFEDAIFRGDRSAARRLIRFIDNRNVYVWEEEPIIDGEEPQFDPAQLQPFSLPVTMLCNVWRKSLANELGIEWLFKRVVNPQERRRSSPRDKREETYERPTLGKIEKSSDRVGSYSDLVSSFALVVNPRYAYYGSEVGFRISLEEEEPGNFTSRQRGDRTQKSQYQYHMDTYLGHLGRMWTCWFEPFSTEVQRNGQPERVIYQSVREELLEEGGRFLQQKIFPRATRNDCRSLFEILVFLAIFTHDLGKLQQEWQNVMKGWQEIADSEFNHRTRHNWPSLLLAHTDYDPSNPTMKQRYDEYMAKYRRPPHAIESAFLAWEILEPLRKPILETHFQANPAQSDGIFGTIVMAAGRHHSAWTNGWELSDVAQKEEITLHEAAGEAIAQTWKRLSPRLLKSLPEGFPLSSETLALQDTIADKKIFTTDVLKLDLFDPDRLEYQQLYALVVRALRLCDMRSVQLGT